MTKNQILTLVIATTLGFAACDKGSEKGFKRTDTGLEYNIVKDEPGDKHPQIGDILSLHIRIRIEDSVFRNSRQMNGNEPIEIPMIKPNFPGDWTEVLPLLTKGDSAVVRISIDTIKKHTQGQFPEFVKEGDMIYYELVLVDFEDSKAMEEKQIGVDEQKLQAYFKEKNITPEKTQSGLYYVIDKPGKGKQVERGSMVSVDYTGKGLDGTTFDSNVEEEFGHVQPFTFQAGRGQVIPGWDEGILLLQEGSQARFFIPSTLAYGSQELPGVGRNANLVFDVKVNSVKEATEQAPGQLPVQ